VSVLWKVLVVPAHICDVSDEDQNLVEIFPSPNGIVSGENCRRVDEIAQMEMLVVEKAEAEVASRVLETWAVGILIRADIFFKITPTMNDAPPQLIPQKRSRALSIQVAIHSPPQLVHCRRRVHIYFAGDGDNTSKLGEDFA